MTKGKRAEMGAIRQFRVTVNDQPGSPLLSVSLSWRVFPCAAAHWDGHWTAEVPRRGESAIASQEALREVLGALAAVPWEGRVVPR